jgi:hypothetical protein
LFARAASAHLAARGAIITALSPRRFGRREPGVS